MSVYLEDAKSYGPLGRRSLLRDALSHSALAALALSLAGFAGAAFYLNLPAGVAPPAPAVAAVDPPVLRRDAGDEAAFFERRVFPMSEMPPLRAQFQSTPPAVAAAPAPQPSPGLAVASLYSEPVGPEAPSVTATLTPEIDHPLPLPRPSDLAPRVRPLRTARANETVVAPAPQAPGPGLFERLFGGAREPSGPALAYANPQDGVGPDRIGRDQAARLPGVVPPPVASSVPVDRATAVYNISARTVTMPDGTRLEAHSGLREMLDDPRYVHVRMRGATPPATYDLRLRESLFHGVQAIRLTPIDSSVHGRSGLLAHTYMLGPNGDSNGCVSFRNYDAFLQAFLRGQVKRLVVVAN